MLSWEPSLLKSSAFHMLSCMQFTCRCHCRVVNGQNHTHPDRLKHQLLHYIGATLIVIFVVKVFNEWFWIHNLKTVGHFFCLAWYNLKITIHQTYFLYRIPPPLYVGSTDRIKLYFTCWKKNNVKYIWFQLHCICHVVEA